jgi:ribonuclease HI
MAELIINCDGGARGNPGPAASAFVVQDTSGKMIFKQGFFLGNATNNQAEYQAVICALEWLEKNYPQSDAVFLLDSLLVVNQINKIFKVKESTLIQKNNLIQEKISSRKTATTKFSYIPREKNFAADLLVNETLDNSSR